MFISIIYFSIKFLEKLCYLLYLSMKELSVLPIFSYKTTLVRLLSSCSTGATQLKITCNTYIMKFRSRFSTFTLLDL